MMPKYGLGTRWSNAAPCASWLTDSCLDERERRRRERRRDARHLDPDQSIARAEDCPVVQPEDSAEPRSEVVFPQRPHGLRARVLEQPGLQVEYGCLTADLPRRKIQRVPQAGIQGEPAGQLP